MSNVYSPSDPHAPAHDPQAPASGAQDPHAHGSHAAHEPAGPAQGPVEPNLKLSIGVGLLVVAAIVLVLLVG